MVVLEVGIIFIVGIYSSFASEGCSFSSDYVIKKAPEEPEGGQDYNFNPVFEGWWKNVRGVMTVPYVFDKAISNTGKSAFEYVMDEFQEGSCVEFKQVDSTYKDPYLLIKTGGSCFDNRNGVGGHVGGDPEIQNIYLYMSKEMCSYRGFTLEDFRIYFGVLRHEFLHAFGLQHTQNRWDRDTFIKVNENNIKENKTSQFNKCRDCDTFGVPYECNSIMHYPPYTFSRNGYPTIDSVSEGCDLSKNPFKLTSNDWLLLHKAAKCHGSPKILPGWLKTRKW